jgi:hypothetical protein
MINKKFISIILVLLLLPVLVSATTYYVDRNSASCNDGGSGTALSAPLCTIRQANRIVQAGDTVLVRAGTYTEDDGSAVIRPWSSGAPNNYITYKNYNGEHVILTGRYQPISLSLGSYIWVEGFEVDVSDLIIVTSDFGKMSGFNNPKSDTNSDGIVDIFDVVYVASRFT